MVFIENDKIKLENTLRDNIKNADEVLIAVAYLRKSGFQLVKDEIIDLIKRGGKIRIIAGLDFGFTEPEALNELKKIGAQIKVYSGEVLFHPKCYIFTSANINKAIVGSSNLSGSALNTGVEWNVLIDDSNILYNEIKNNFDQLWKSVDTVEISDKVLKKLKKDNNRWNRRIPRKTRTKIDTIREAFITFNFKVNKSFLEYSSHPVTIPTEYNSTLDEYQIDKNFSIKLIFNNYYSINGYIYYSKTGDKYDYPYYQIKIPRKIDTSIINGFKLDELIKIEIKFNDNSISIHFIKS